MPIDLALECSAVSFQYVYSLIQLSRCLAHAFEVWGGLEKRSPSELSLRLHDSVCSAPKPTTTINLMREIEFYDFEKGLRDRAE
mmetsp:Transcript_51420/g.100950  ORF Transcript_51420/g.100950 Transcript_51420/m.100950 type:complete len:84 (+) Transcript_51420:460-711(+)